MNDQNEALFLWLLALSPFIMFGVAVVVSFAVMIAIDALAKPFGFDPFSLRKG